MSKQAADKKALEAELAKYKPLAEQALPLALQTAGFDSDSETADLLQTRFQKATAAGYEKDFLSWVRDTEGAAKDPIAARFRAAPSPAPAQAPKAEAPKAEAPPAAPPAARAPSTPTTTSTTAPPQVGWTEAQVKAANDRLLVEYSKATAERKAAIKTEMEANRQKIAPVT